MTPKASSRSHGQSPPPDLELAGAVRSALIGMKPVTEVKMFGGIGFMLNGHLLVAASKRGLLLRVGTDRQSQALAKPGTRQMEMRGRPMAGYVYVHPPIRPAAVRERWRWRQPSCALCRPRPRRSGRRLNRRGRAQHEAARQPISSTSHPDGGPSPGN